eukprot:CCRYP_009942-RE/>CCRYP_009942-RE protein AED:0.20 eAED:0.26 QI:0/1/0.5/1/0/0/2/3148/273
MSAVKPTIVNRRMCEGQLDHKLWYCTARDHKAVALSAVSVCHSSSSDSLQHRNSVMICFTAGTSRFVFSRLSAQAIRYQFTAFSDRAKSRPIPTIPFGIVAALTTDNVIGINGALPWKHLPQDKAHFTNMTRDKILIIGRKSFVEEDPTGENVRHARACVVLSRKMDHDALFALKRRRANGPELRLARSFEEALCVAQELRIAESHDEKSSKRNRQFDSSLFGGEEGIDCWIAGGEGIYREALQHQNLRKIGFEEVSRSVNGICTFCLFERRE